MPIQGNDNKNSIIIRGARVHNLKNISLSLPRDKFIVITGLSGSGKSSLAFDTLYAEGQRRYVESLSSYARQFLGRVNKPEVDFISGIPPAIAIEQKVNSQNPRSTVGTSTEIYDYLKLLFARIGRTVSPVSGSFVTKHSVADVVDYVLGLPEGCIATILAPVKISNGLTVNKYLELYLKQGITRVELNNEIVKIIDLVEKKTELCAQDLFLLIDRVTVNTDQDNSDRIADSIETAFSQGQGYCTVKFDAGSLVDRHDFSVHFEADGMEFEEPTEYLFSFNNPLGACPKCEGYGKVIGIDEELVVPDKSLSIYEEAIACWRGEKMSKWREKLILNAHQFDFPIHKPFYELTNEQEELIWTGNKWFWGLNKFFKYIEENNYKIQYRVMQSRYRGKTTCTVCRGTRLKVEASYVKINGKPIQELVELSIEKLFEFISTLELSKQEKQIAGRLLTEISNRIEFLVNVGLGYLTLNRLFSTLSGGEAQRINLATSLGSSLVGSLYILDEPSIGLHSRDTEKLIGIIKNLKNIGNTVLVVEHDEEIMRSAEQIIDIGPLAGRLGGEIVFQGTYNEIVKNVNSLTGKYLSGKEKIDVPFSRRKWNNFIELIGCRENNLKVVDTKIPLNVLTAVTGVSGSGKSSLVKGILYPAALRLISGQGSKPGKFGMVRGDTHLLKSVELIDQNPIGRNSRSNPITYIKAYDEIRKLYSIQTASKLNKFQPAHFSFNVDGGRCDECMGEGIIKVEMQFMADIHLICESCEGKRFKPEVLEVRYRGKNIHDLLELSVEEAIAFFDSDAKDLGHKIAEKLKPLDDVGLGYVKLGQASNTLSGGESQRVKLASFLGRDKSSGHCLFIFDEPTTGLHFHDIKKLLLAFNALIKQGHTILVVEHNLEVIKSADWIIDLGPDGGEKGGYIVFEGTPEQLILCNDSYTGTYLRDKLKENPG